MSKKKKKPVRKTENREIKKTVSKTVSQTVNNEERQSVLSKVRIIGLAGTVLAAVLLVILGTVLDRSRRDRNVISLLAADGTEFAKLRREEEGIRFDCELKYMTYVGVVWEEAKERLGEEALFDGATTVYTCFDREKFDVLSTAAEGVPTEQYGDTALCLTDTKGRIYATYQKTADLNDNTNYVLAGTSAGSAIKPLSVYGPAIEAGEIGWGTLIKDEPLFYVENSDGTKEPWPVNAEDHGGKDYLVSDAVKHSINTIAVRILKDHGVTRAMDFLEQSFGMDLSRERELAKKDGEDSVLGNLALGELRQGVTVKDMAGYYQAFANGGMYQPAFAVEKIEMDGTTVYSHSDSMKRVFSEETAYICNRLLKGVLSQGGTGEAAYVEGLDICGKTGTSDGYRDYWFVGFTPEYVCACRCGNVSGHPLSEKPQLLIFKKVMEGLSHDKSSTYPASEKVKEVTVCRKSGKEAGDNCKDTESGYFPEAELPAKCEE